MRTRESGLTLVELLVTLGLFGIFGMISMTVLLNANSYGTAAESRRMASAVLSQSRALFIKRYDQRAPSGGVDPELRPGNPRVGLEKKLTVNRTLRAGRDAVTFETSCRKVPKAVAAAVSKALGKNADLSKVLLSTQLGALGNVCRPENLVELGDLACPKDERPVLHVTHVTKVGKKMDRLTFEFPSPTTPVNQGVAGGFCVIRSATLEYTLGFQQVLLENGKLVYRKRDLLVALSDQDPYAPNPGAGIVYLPPKD